MVADIGWRADSHESGFAHGLSARGPDLTAPLDPHVADALVQSLGVAARHRWPARLTDPGPTKIGRPPDLSHYFSSERGEFRLSELGGGRTLLEGTTRYELRFAPARDWRFWFDRIVRQIHGDLFDQIRNLAEADQRREGPSLACWRARRTWWRRSQLSRAPAEALNDPDVLSLRAISARRVHSVRRSQSCRRRAARSATTRRNRASSGGAASRPRGW